jgi:hypothetical protein
LETVAADIQMGAVVTIGCGHPARMDLAHAQGRLRIVDEEIERMLAANPGLLAELREHDRRAALGEDVGEFLSSDELRRRLGLPRRKSLARPDRCGPAVPTSPERLSARPSAFQTGLRRGATS